MMNKSSALLLLLLLLSTGGGDGGDGEEGGAGGDGGRKDVADWNGGALLAWGEGRSTHSVGGASFFMLAW